MAEDDGPRARTTIQLSVLNVTPTVLDATVPDENGIARKHRIVKSVDPRSGISIDLVFPLETAQALGRRLAAPPIEITQKMP